MAFMPLRVTADLEACYEHRESNNQGAAEMAVESVQIPDDRRCTSEEHAHSAESSEEERRVRRHPGDFYTDWPSNDQMEYFKRGGR
jgi:hypothetical protein